MKEHKSWCKVYNDEPLFTCNCEGVKYWAINVTCWGTLYALGTEEQAEEWRAHKANWEKCVARKREMTDEEVKEEVAAGKIKDLKKLLS